jgi:steroid delta-isomerase
MADEHIDRTPALVASQASWQRVQTRDKAGWLALMAEDVLIEDPIGPGITNPEGHGIRGKEALGAFYDQNIATNNLTITCEETFPSSSPQEIAHVLTLRSRFEGGLISTVRGVFCYRVDDGGLITNLRGYWNMDAMTFDQEEDGETPEALPGPDRGEV